MVAGVEGDQTEEGGGTGGNKREGEEGFRGN